MSIFLYYVLAAKTNSVGHKLSFFVYFTIHAAEFWWVVSSGNNILQA